MAIARLRARGFREPVLVVDLDFHDGDLQDVFRLFASPAHPYTHGLLASLPRVGQKQHRLHSIDGLPPRLDRLPPGCAFAPRCARAADRCRSELPALALLSPGHQARCHFPIIGAGV